MSKIVSGNSRFQAPRLRKTTVFGSRVGDRFFEMKNVSNKVPATFNFAAFKQSLESEGWSTDMEANVNVRIIYNGTSYVRAIRYLLDCDFGNLPAPLVDDILDALRAQGLCGAT